MPRFSFDDYKNMFEGAIKKYRGDKFFANLIQQRGQPEFPSEEGNVAIIGIRHEGKRKDFRDDTANDTIALVYLDEHGNKKVSEYVGTTEPGLTAGQNKLGLFKLSPGFYYFKLGKHHQKNPCLVQDCAVLGERAKPGKDWDETDEVTWQITDGSLHIHAGIRNLNHVGNWSEGCTVIAGDWPGKPWNEFFGIARKATNFPIPYVLVKEADAADLIALGQSKGSNGSNGSAAAPQHVTVDGVGVAVAAPVATAPDEARAAVAPPPPTVAPPPPTVATTPPPPPTVAAQESSGKVVQASTGSSKRTTATIAGVAVAAVAGIKGFLDANPVTSALIIIAVVAAVIWLITWYIHVQRDLDKKRMELAADPGKKNVR
ncbi:MAG TPA: hypothetical protein VGP08_18135 [Pyrinomonadaceae bacterium]|jgi:hypothetical protein|nr:hypothetical protein [Pyrinomonadaceae bacterium]